MRHAKLCVMMSFLLLIFVGCSNGKNEFTLIASGKTLPVNFQEIATVRKSPPNFQYLVRKASNLSNFDETWRMYGFENEIPSVDFSLTEVFFVGVYESGSCPIKVKAVKVNSDNKTITVPLEEPKGVCTTDANPRTFVIGLDKVKSKDIANMVIVQSPSGVETNIHLEN